MTEPTSAAPPRSARIRAQGAVHRAAGITVMAWLVTACGGGGSASPSPADPNADRIAAATSTANHNRLCTAIAPFYWEIGDARSVDAASVLAAGSVGLQSNGQPVQRDTALNVASGSKWPFAAYVVQKHGLLTSQVPYLNFTSGYSNFDNTNCTSATQTVAGCNNGGINPFEAQGHLFHYQGGHMMQLAVDLGLGPMDAAALTTEVLAQIGNDTGMVYVLPQPPGGLRASAGHYATFLRKLLVDSPTPLRIGALLGTQAVCTQPVNGCPAAPQAADAIPENLHYSLGHWVEDDPATTPSAPVDNRAYSDAGKFGFYPWVDFPRKLYGIVARENRVSVADGQGYASLQCGRAIRLAWKTGVAQ